MYLSGMSTPSPRTRFVILGLLCSEPASGYAVKQSIDETVGGFWQESYGQLYPTLKQLTAEGLVTEAAASTGGRKRTIYTITDAGRAALQTWLTEPPTPEHTRSEIALKVFFGAWAPPGAVVGHLRSTAARARAQAAQLAAVQRTLVASQAEAPELVWWTLTANLGERVARARAEWAEAALQTIGSEHD